MFTARIAGAPSALAGIRSMARAATQVYIVLYCMIILTIHNNSNANDVIIIIMTSNDDNYILMII